MRDDRAADRRGPARRRRHRRRREHVRQPAHPVACEPCSPSRPGRVHSAPAPNTDWMFFNVRRRPFDDLARAPGRQLRDRPCPGRGAPGGPEVGQPACQFVPPPSPVTRPIARTPPSRAGPRMDRARHGARAPARGGVRASRGAVVVHMPDYRVSSAATTRGCSRISGSAHAADPGLQRATTSTRTARGRQTGLVRLGCRLPRGVELPRAGLRLRRVGAQNITRLCDRAAGPPDRSRARRAAGGGGRPSGRPPTGASSTSRRRAADHPALRGPRLQARGQRQDAPPAVHADRPDVGPLSLESFQNWNL